MYGDLDEVADPVRYPVSLQQSSHPRTGYGHIFPTLAELQLQQEVVRLAREASRLEHERDMERREAKIQSNRADFYRAESIRLRNERDMERVALASLQKQYDAAQTSFHRKQQAESDLSASYENVYAPILEDFGAMISSVESLQSLGRNNGTANNYVHPLGASWLENDRRGSVSSMTKPIVLVKPKDSSQPSPEQEWTS